MASLRKMVGEFKDELREGIAYVAFWKEGRSWNAEAFWMDDKGRFEVEDLDRVEEILDIDSLAIIVNGYNDCPFTFGDRDMKASAINFMMEHIKWRYEEHRCMLVDLYEVTSESKDEVDQEERIYDPEEAGPVPENVRDMVIRSLIAYDSTLELIVTGQNIITFIEDVYRYELHLTTSGYYFTDNYDGSHRSKIYCVSNYYDTCKHIEHLMMNADDFKNHIESLGWTGCKTNTKQESDLSITILDIINTISTQAFLNRQHVLCSEISDSIRTLGSVDALIELLRSKGVHAEYEIYTDDNHPCMQITYIRIAGFEIWKDGNYNLPQFEKAIACYNSCLQESLPQTPKTRKSVVTAKVIDRIYNDAVSNKVSVADRDPNRSYITSGVVAGEIRLLRAMGVTGEMGTYFDHGCSHVGYIRVEDFVIWKDGECDYDQFAAAVEFYREMK